MQEVIYSISIVSHNQISYVNNLINDLNSIIDNRSEVIITINDPLGEKFELSTNALNFKLKVIQNKNKKGFGANHNHAFQISKGNFFIVLNPDIRINKFDFEKFISSFSSKKVAALAPIVLDEFGNISDSARKFPTPFSLIKRFIFKSRKKNDYPSPSGLTTVDWVAGMFIAFRASQFKEIDGFDDQNFFMYLEDVDICKRLSLLGLKACINPKFEITHYAQRDSHRNFRNFIWHIESAIKFFKKHPDQIKF